MEQYVLKIDCKDEKGLIYRIADVVFKYQLNIVKNDEFVDPERGRFFMRAVLSGEADMAAFQGTLGAMLPSDAVIYCSEQRKKNIVLMGTKESHCLGDILLKHDSNDLNANILAIVSNYDDVRPLAQKFDIPYHYVSHVGLEREEHEARVLETLGDYAIDFLVLAKYMRILSPEFVRHYAQRTINIHHSFLPAFIGANPYKQAHERGVKIIGATAHFVTNDLDEGPIIAQDVIHVSHEMSWKEMQRAGRNVEKVVLSNALDLALEDRIFVHENKTIIF